MLPPKSVSSIRQLLKDQCSTQPLLSNDRPFSSLTKTTPDLVRRSSNSQGNISPSESGTSGSSVSHLLASAQRKLKRSVFSINQVIRKQLRRNDFFNRSIRSYVDEYRLRDIQAGQLVELTLRSRSKKLIPRLQVINARTGNVFDDIDINDRVVRLMFIPEAGDRYFVRVSNDLPRKTGKYTLRGQQTALTTNPLPTLNPDNNSSISSLFSTLYGYGLVNAAAAVARSIGQSIFADVAFQDVSLNNPNDLNGSYLWGVDRVMAPEVWARGYTGEGVTVAVVDTGVDYLHPDLQNNIWINVNEIPNNGLDDDGNGFIDDVRGWDFVSNDNTPFDSAPSTEVGHGTFIAGLIAANHVGFTDIAGRQLGVAPNAKIMPVRVFPSLSWNGISEQIASGIRYAADNGADVINLSLGYGDGNQPNSVPDPAIESALQYARQSGVVVVIAAGNERTNPGAVRPSEPAYAAIRDLGIAVGAIEKSGQFADFSNPAGNRLLDYVVAPGVDIFSTSYDPTRLSPHTYEIGSGTSFAAPYVAGIAALMLSANPNLTPAEIETILVQTTNPQGVFV